jgi:hypothetical protein
MAEKPGTFKLELVEEDENTAAPPDNRTELATNALTLALTALSQRALVALASLFSLLTVASVFWLGMAISADPNPYQITTLAIYAAFVIAVNIIVRRK